MCNKQSFLFHSLKILFFFYSIYKNICFKLLQIHLDCTLIVNQMEQLHVIISTQTNTIY